jgi:hypothetical protein
MACKRRGRGSTQQDGRRCLKANPYGAAIDFDAGPIQYFARQRALDLLE